MFKGIFAIAKPCSVVVEVKEMFGSESKTQVYAHLHELLQKPSMHSIGNKEILRCKCNVSEHLKLSDLPKKRTSKIMNMNISVYN